MSPLDSLLKQLAEADAAAEAPPQVEAALLKAFRKESPPPRRGWWWTLAAVTASVAAAVIAYETLRTDPKQQALAQPPKPVAQVAAVAAPPAPVPERPARPKLVARARKAPRPVPPPAETVTEFIPVTPGEPVAPDEGSRVVRLQLPASALASFGFRVVDDRSLDRVQADVMLRRDGSPSAIRLVNASVFR